MCTLGDCLSTGRANWWLAVHTQTNRARTCVPQLAHPPTHATYIHVAINTGILNTRFANSPFSRTPLPRPPPLRNQKFEPCNSLLIIIMHGWASDYRLEMVVWNLTCLEIGCLEAGYHKMLTNYLIYELLWSLVIMIGCLVIHVGVLMQSILVLHHT